MIQFRTIVYIDGFNLYFGLRSKGWKKYYWLDLDLFGKTLSRGRQYLRTKYYTAYITGDNEKINRQRIYLSALKNHCSNLDIIRGKYLSKEWQCRECGSRWKRFEEKQTDVNIATDLLIDAFQDNYDVAILVSADSDLIPPIRKILHHWPDKQIIVAFPPGRGSKDLKQHASSSFKYMRKR